MMVSTRGRYALRMMQDLAEHQGDGYVALKDIAERQGISKKYLEQIIPALNKVNLLQTVRGYQGGYRLVKSPAEYTIGELLRAPEATLFIWEGLEEAVNSYLDGITLQDVLDRSM